MVIPDQHKVIKKPVIYKVYPERWWLLGSVILLNLANYAHWIAFPAVAKKAAAYYAVTGDMLDMIPTVSYAAGVPTCLLATYFVEAKGLKFGLRIGSYLTGIGGFLCCISTFYGINQYIPIEVQFWSALVGQALTGIACPFISCVPTKISQHWFADNQRTMATTVLGMSYPLGIVIGQGITPWIVKGPEDIPMMNTVFFVPAFFGAVLGVWKINSDTPPTPPSKSSVACISRKLPYLSTLKEVFTNRAFVIIFFFLGGAMSFISCLATKMEQIMCSVGYSDELAGMCCSLVILSGAVGTIVLGIAAEKTGRMVEITKICCFGSITCILVMSYLLLMPDMSEYIIAASIPLGIFALGVFPLALELTVEATFPSDQATVTCFIFFSSSIQGVMMMMTETWLGSTLPPHLEGIETCSMSHDHHSVLQTPGLSSTTSATTLFTSGAAHNMEGKLEPKDYTTYLLFVVVYLIILVLIYLFFFKTELRRTNANIERIKSLQNLLDTDDVDIERLLPGGLTMIKAKSPRKRLITC